MICAQKYMIANSAGQVHPDESCRCSTTRQSQGPCTTRPSNHGSPPARDHDTPDRGRRRQHLLVIDQRRSIPTSMGLSTRVIVSAMIPFDGASRRSVSPWGCTAFAPRVAVPGIGDFGAQDGQLRGASYLTELDPSKMELDVRHGSSVEEATARPQHKMWEVAAEVTVQTRGVHIARSPHPS
uniref:Uncharacterized protein n=1 Tax=Rhodococcus sp. NS1 TaxID=402236 RepID=A0A097SQH7_9NOCA|nr:hypothetical protein LRS1606.354 [Rhodococcus sp. NS1]